MLICFVGVLVGLDVLILFLAAVIPQSRIHAVLSQSSDKPNIENAVSSFFREGCIPLVIHAKIKGMCAHNPFAN